MKKDPFPFTSSEDYAEWRKNLRNAALKVIGDKFDTMADGMLPVILLHVISDAMPESHPAQPILLLLSKLIEVTTVGEPDPRRN